MRVLLVLLVALAAACGSGTSSAPKTTPQPAETPLPPSSMDATAQIKKLAERACACKDKKKAAPERVECARTVVHDLVTLAENNKELVNQDDTATAANEAGVRIGNCVMEAGLPAQELADEMKKLEQKAKPSEG